MNNPGMHYQSCSDMANRANDEPQDCQTDCELATGKNLDQVDQAGDRPTLSDL